MDGTGGALKNAGDGTNTASAIAESRPVPLDLLPFMIYVVRQKPVDPSSSLRGRLP